MQFRQKSKITTLASFQIDRCRLQIRSRIRIAKPSRHAEGKSFSPSCVEASSIRVRERFHLRHGASERSVTVWVIDDGFLLGVVEALANLTVQWSAALFGGDGAASV